MYDRGTSPELLERHPELHGIIGAKTALYPYENPEAPDPEKIAPFMGTGTDPYA